MGFCIWFSTEIESLYSVSVGAFITVIPNARELTDYILDPIFEGLVASGKNPTKKVNAYLYPVPRKWIHRALFAYFKGWSRRALDFRVEGLENVQEGRQYIFCPNHQTHFDGLFTWTVLGDKCPDIDHFGCMSKAEHLDSWITRLMMKTLGGIPVERTGNTIDSTQQSPAAMRSGLMTERFPKRGIKRRGANVSSGSPSARKWRPSGAARVRSPLRSGRRSSAAWSSRLL